MLEGFMRYYADEPAGIDNPKKAGDAGYDLRSDRTVLIRFGQYVTFSTAAVEIPEGHCGLIIGRSGNNSQGLLTAFGLIDSGFRGKIRVVLYSIDPGHKDFPMLVRKGDRIAQLVIVAMITPALLAVDSIEDLSLTERGDSGFGSTNV